MSEPKADIRSPNLREIAVQQQFQRGHAQQSVTGTINLLLVQSSGKPPTEPYPGGDGEHAGCHHEAASPAKVRKAPSTKSATLFDHLVGAAEQRRGDIDATCD
jgi:hypothetical protein